MFPSPHAVACPVLARAVMTTRLLGAGLRATGSVPEKEAILTLATFGRIVRIGAAVALFVLLCHSRFRTSPGASLPWCGAGGTGLDLAGARAAVAIGGVSVVTGLATCDLAVAHRSGCRLSRERDTRTVSMVLQSPSNHRALGVVVVASLVNRQYSIPHTL